MKMRALITGSHFFEKISKKILKKEKNVVK